MSLSLSRVGHGLRDADGQVRGSHRRLFSLDFKQLSKQWVEKLLKCHLLVAHIQIPPSRSKKCSEGQHITLGVEEFRKWKVTNSRQACHLQKSGLVIYSSFATPDA
jgi:hypothetical protein